MVHSNVAVVSHTWRISNNRRSRKDKGYNDKDELRHSEPSHRCSGAYARAAVTYVRRTVTSQDMAGYQLRVDLLPKMSQDGKQAACNVPRIYTEFIRCI